MENISKISTKNKNPNLTIVLPGPCQAKCSFCTWKQDDNEKKFLKSLKKLMKRLPKNFTQISISGGEPTLSPVLSETLTIISKAKKKGKIQKVVLTTNGVNLLETADLMKNVVDHVNISRHHFNEDDNQKIFGTKHIPTFQTLPEITKKLNSFGIDVNFNCVLTDETKKWNENHLYNFIVMAQGCGVSSISFRNQYDDFKASELQEEVEKSYKARTEQSCPVCFTKVFLINGMPIKFHHSSFEPTEEKTFKETNETYELILHGNGVLAKDWEGKKEVSLKKDKPKERVMRVIEKTYSSCGINSYSACNPKKSASYSSC